MSRGDCGCKKENPCADKVSQDCDKINCDPCEGLKGDKNCPIKDLKTDCIISSAEDHAGTKTKKGQILTTTLEKHHIKFDEIDKEIKEIKEVVKLIYAKLNNECDEDPLNVEICGLEEVKKLLIEIKEKG